MTDEGAFFAVFFGGLVAAIAFALWAPGRIKRSHVLKQNRLMERCRVHYLLAVRALEFGDEAGARALLQRIRRVESHWRLGNSVLYRLALAVYSVWLGYVGYVAVRAASIVVLRGPQITSSWSAEGLAQDLLFLSAMGISGALYALSSYFSGWQSPWIVYDCGDRLEQMLRAGRSMLAASEADPATPDGLTPRELFGLEPGYSLKELNAARRHLAAKFHPDRWQNASPAKRKAAEAAMKRVNAAFDDLRSAVT